MNYRTKQIIVAAMAALLTSSGCAKESENAPSVIISKIDKSDMCGYNRILPSESGDNIAVFFQESRFTDERDFYRPEGFIVFSKNSKNVDFKESISFQPSIISSGVFRSRPIGWYHDKLEFRVGSDYIFSYDIKGEIISKDFNLPEGLSEFEIYSHKALREFHPNLIRANKSAENINSYDDARRKSIFLEKTPFFSYVDLKNGQSSAFGLSLDQMKNLGPAAYLHGFGIAADVSLTKRDGVRPHFLGSEVDRAFRGRVIPYSRPLIDYSNGNVVGSFTPDNYSFFSGKYARGEGSSNFDESIIDAVTIAGRIFVLVESDRGISLIVRSVDGEASYSKFDVCSKATKKNIQPAYRRIGSFKFQSPSEMVGTLFKNSASSTDKLIIYFHGGPAGTLLDQFQSRSFDYIGELGFDILAVEYAGSVGGGLNNSMRLSRSEGYGFSEDSSYLREWVSNSKYEKTFIFAESFGAVPALVFYRNNVDVVSGSVFISPLLYLPSPDTTENSEGSLFAQEVGSQLQFESGVFGGIDERNAFSLWLKNLSSSFAASRVDLFVFGALDKKTPMSSAPPYITDRAKVVEVPRADHNLLRLDDRARALVLQHIDTLDKK